MEGSSGGSKVVVLEVVGISKVDSSDTGRGLVILGAGGAGAAAASLALCFACAASTIVSLGGGGACLANLKISSSGSALGLSSAIPENKDSSSGLSVLPSYQVLEASCLFMSFTRCSICSACSRLISRPRPPGLLSPKPTL